MKAFIWTQSKLVPQGKYISSHIQTLQCGFCNLHSSISVTPHFPLSTNLWKSKLEKKPFQRKKCLSSSFSLRRCTLIRIGRNDEKNQHLQKKWTLSIIKERMKGWSARLGLWKFSTHLKPSVESQELYTTCTRNKTTLPNSNMNLKKKKLISGFQKGNVNGETTFTFFLHTPSIISSYLREHLSANENMGNRTLWCSTVIKWIIFKCQWNLWNRANLKEIHAVILKLWIISMAFSNALGQIHDLILL